MKLDGKTPVVCFAENPSCAVDNVLIDDRRRGSASAVAVRRREPESSPIASMTPRLLNFCGIVVISTRTGCPPGEKAARRGARHVRDTLDSLPLPPASRPSSQQKKQVRGLLCPSSVSRQDQRRSHFKRGINSSHVETTQTFRYKTKSNSGGIKPTKTQ